MNISLIKVREPSVDVPEVTPPLGLLYLAGYLRRYRPGKDNIRLFDLSVQKETRVLEGIKDSDIIGLSSTNRDGLYLSRFINKIQRTDHVIIIGGPIVSSLKEEVFDYFDVDCGVAYEGERTFLELIEKFDNGDIPFEGIKGIVFKKGGAIFTGRREGIEDLDREIPFPAWDLILEDPIREEYWRRKSFAFFRVNKRYMGLFTSRGCPYRCIYCHDIFSKQFRAHSPERVISEIEYLNKRYGIRDFEFYDDTFNFDKDRVRRICDLIIERKLKINLYFPNGVRVDRLDRDIIERLARAGTRVMCFAIETVSERLQRLLKRNLRFENLDDMIEIAIKNGIHAEGFFMLGHPTETKEEMLATINYAVRSPLHSAAFSITTPQKGTELFSMYVSENARQGLGEGYYDNSSAISQLTPHQVKRLLGYTFIRFYLRPIRLFRIFRTFPLTFIFSRRFIVQIFKWLDVTLH
ncbi:MAG: hypothetical protein Fur0020_15300 [Thermodesulfovibrionia bacterium]